MSDDSKWAPPVDGVDDIAAPLPEPPAVFSPTPGEPSSVADERWSHPDQPVPSAEPPRVGHEHPGSAAPEREDITPAVPTLRPNPGHAQSDPLVGAHQPLDPLQQWTSQISPAVNPFSTVAQKSGPHPNRRPRTWLTVGSAVIVIAVLVLTPFITRWTSIDREAAVGYSGTTASTGHPSSDWSHGVAVAWTLPIPLDSDRPTSTFASIANGTTLIVVSSDGSALPQLVAYDVAGATPQELWRLSADIVIYSSNELSLWGDLLLLDGYLIDIETGARIVSPWSADTRVKIVGDMAIACDWDGLCTGWASPTEQLWQRRLPTRASLSDDIVGEGDDQWTIVTDYSADMMLLFNIRTGETSSFEVKPDYAYLDSEGPIIAASDGWAVIPGEKDSMSLLAPDGSLIETFDIDYRRVTRGPRPVLGPRRPTIEEIGRQWRDEVRTWGDGLVGFTGENCEDMVMNNQKISIEGINSDYSLSYGYDGECTVELEGFVLSTDRSIGLGFYDFERHPFFADSATGSLVDVKKTRKLSEPTLVFDDLLVGVSGLGLVALTPSLS